MRYEFADALNTDTGAEGTIWLGDHTTYKDKKEFSKVRVGGEKRLMLGRLLRLAKLYSSQADARRALGHDCITFAYSWESGDTYDTTLAGRAGGAIVLPHALTRLSSDLGTAPLTAPGDVVFTVDTPIRQVHELEPSPHFMVHANVDDGETLYLSKFGSEGPVILTTFEQSLQLYSAQTVGVASHFGIQQ